VIHQFTSRKSVTAMVTVWAPFIPRVPKQTRSFTVVPDFGAPMAPLTQL
jgi:hypothetical protein